MYSMLFDLFSSLTSLLSTYYFIRMDSKAWLVGVIATLLNGWLYYQKGIYGDMVLESLYFLSMGYGWTKWRKKGTSNTNNSGLVSGSLRPLQWVSLGLIFCFVFTGIHYLLQAFTHSTVALLDAATTSLSLMAQLLMCHKVIGTWILWFITDALYAAMYLHKNLPFHSILMIVYTVMAIVGYLSWKRRYKKSLTASPEYEEINLRLSSQTQV